MLAVVQKPHIEISINGEGAKEALDWIARKFRVHIVSGKEQSDIIPVEETDFYREMELNRSGNLLEAARLKNNLSQKQVADIVGIRQTMVSEFETGKRKITSKMAKRLADALKIKPERLI